MKPEPTSINDIVHLILNADLNVVLPKIFHFIAVTIVVVIGIFACIFLLILACKFILDKYKRAKEKNKGDDLSRKKIRAQTSTGYEAKNLEGSDLYCYQCTKKLGLKGFKIDNFFYCEQCLKIGSQDKVL